MSWTKTTRVDHDRSDLRYASDCRDEAWRLIAIGASHHRADTGDRHQAPAHIIVPDNGQQTTVQDAELFAKHPPDNE